jgi:hypothetical protein
LTTISFGMMDGFLFLQISSEFHTSPAELGAGWQFGKADFGPDRGAGKWD